MIELIRVIVMIGLIIIVIVCAICKKIMDNNLRNLFFKVINIKTFSNVKNIHVLSNFTAITADNKGENFLFLIKNNGYQITKLDVNSIYEVSKKMHFHNVVLIANIVDINIIKLLNSYNIVIWDKNKLNSLLNDTINNDSNIYGVNDDTKRPTILSTSNVSDDKCKIDDNSFEPIQDGSIKKGIFNELFNKPDRL